MRPGKLCGEDVASGADREGQVIFTGGGEEESWRCEGTQDLEPEEGRGLSWSVEARFIHSYCPPPPCPILVCRVRELNEWAQSVLLWYFSSQEGISQIL